MKTISIGGRLVGRGERPFVIAEMSGNHNRSLDRALEIVDAAADSGADAVKLQTYRADTMTIDADAPGFRIDDPDSLWNGRSLYGLYDEAHTPWEWHAPIFERARSRGLICFSSPFDETAIAFLEELAAPAYKIASFEITDLRLIRTAASTGKPLIISTGMATAAEIDDAARTARSAGDGGLALLKCTSSYPATPENSHVSSLPLMREMFGCEVGLSDHTLGVGAAAAAVAFGASVIEKHFTLSRRDGGVDAAFSMEPEEMRSLTAETERAWQAVGTPSVGPSAAEKGSARFRRSLYIVQDVRAGDALTPHNLARIRPGGGLSPKYYDAVLGQTVGRDAPRGTPFHWDLLKQPR